ncbi:hypothetical protein LA345_23525 [Burkholderia vietnamiensis]|nr:hypothetical protein [Burkholderia vietnamiensis]
MIKKLTLAALVVSLSACTAIPLPLIGQSHDSQPTAQNNKIEDVQAGKEVHTSYGTVIDIDPSKRKEKQSLLSSIQSRIQDGLATNKTVELVLHMEDTNRIIKITEQTNETFKLGERVKLIGTGKDFARVTH